MGILIKFFIVFWAIWILWYITGGPLRDDKNHPFVGLTKTGELKSFGTSTLPK